MVLILAAFVAGSSVAGPLSPPDGNGDPTDFEFAYDDGTAAGFLPGSGAVWFHVQDFDPAWTGADLTTLEFWFYHSSSFPWDTSSFYADLYEGGPGVPGVLLEETLVTAVHLAPVFAAYPSPVSAGADFQGVADTQMSAGGWPSLAIDASPSGHSFTQSGGPAPGDYLVRAYGQPLVDLGETTWGSIKGLFGR